MHLTSMIRGMGAAPLFIIELDYGDTSADGEDTHQEPFPFPLTMRQAHQLHHSLGRLLATVPT
jgi:hypothetical protein